MEMTKENRSYYEELFGSSSSVSACAPCADPAAAQVLFHMNKTEREVEMEELEDYVLSTLQVRVPNVSWEDVIGHDRAKTELRKAINVPMDFPGSIQAKKTSRGILLFGPGGVGKTHIVRAAAATAEDYTFLHVDAGAVISRWQGESEKVFGLIFKHARESAPSIIFIDEVDSFCMARGAEESDSTRRVKTKLLTEMQGFEIRDELVVVIGTSNRPMDLDEAFLRRFTQRIYTPLPNTIERAAFFQLFLKDLNHNLTDAEVKKLANITEKFSGDDIERLVADASLAQLDQVYKSDSTNRTAQLQQTTKADFNMVLKRARETVKDGTITALERWDREHGSGDVGSKMLEEEPVRKEERSLWSMIYQGTIECFGNSFDGYGSVLYATQK